MFAKLALLALATAAIASPLERRNAPPASSCTTGTVDCCNSVESAGGPTASKLLALLGVVVQDVNVLVGITCTPITVIGAGSGASCSSQAVCCDNDSFHGVVAIGCTPVDLSL